MLCFYTNKLFVLNCIKYILHPSPEKSKGMADKAEKDLAISGSCEYVRGLDGNGNSIKIPMFDFSEIIKTDAVRKNHSDDYIDCNTLKQTIIVSGYKWDNAPSSGISILEVLSYSGDWVLQRFTHINPTPQTWVRTYHEGTTWGEWRLL